MSRIACVLIAASLASACSSSQQYQLGRAVTSVQLSGNQLQVETCDLVVTEQGNEGDAALVVLVVLLLPLLLFGGGHAPLGGGGSDASVTTEACSSRTTAVVPAALALGGAR